MNKIIVNTHKDFIETEDPELVARYQKYATENLLAIGWDVVEFENVQATYSSRTQTDWETEIPDGGDTQDALERAIDHALNA